MKKHNEKTTKNNRLTKKDIKNFILIFISFTAFTIFGGWIDTENPTTAANVVFVASIIWMLVFLYANCIWKRK